jgi:hypothetical protein
MRVVFGALVATLLCFNAAHATDFSCPKPIAVPDAWNDVNENGNYDPGTDIYDPVTTGYGSQDKGHPLLLVQSSLNATVTLGSYFPVDFPALNRGNPLTGAEVYQTWLATCAPLFLAPTDSLLVEAGMKQGPTIQGCIDLINQDPTAHWDGESVISDFAASPRLMTLLAYDPNYATELGRNVVVLVKFLKVFLESVGPGSTLYVRLIDTGTDMQVPINPTTWGGLKGKY